MSREKTMDTPVGKMMYRFARTVTMMPMSMRIPD
jgi:hypothetical protein